MFSFLSFSPKRWIIYSTAEPVESINDGCGRRANFNAASLPQIRHSGDPAGRHTDRFTGDRQGFRDGRIGIFSQEYPLHDALLEGFPELFGTDDDPKTGQIGQTAALGYSTKSFSIHTR